MTPKVAILIPSYNSAKTIAATLDSIQAQATNLVNITAVYLADDYSSDESVLVAVSTWKSAIPLKVLKGECNLGERGNVNRTLNLLRTELDWILLLHADDLAKS